LLLRHFEDQLVVDLEEHAALHASLLHLLVEADHGRLDDIRCGPLNRGVHRRPFSKAATVVIAGADLREVPAAMEHRGDISVLPRLLYHAIHIFLHAGITFKIALDKLRRYLAGHVQVLAQSVIADTVDDPEIDRLGLPAHEGSHFIFRDVEYIHRRLRMD